MVLLEFLFSVVSERKLVLVLDDQIFAEFFFADSKLTVRAHSMGFLNRGDAGEFVSVTSDKVTVVGFHLESPLQTRSGTYPHFVTTMCRHGY